MIARTGRCLLLFLAAALLATACACGSNSSSGDWLPRVSGPDGPVYLAAAGGGTLTRDGDCLYVVEGGVRYLLAFPKETALASWDERSQVLTLRGHRYLLGAEMHFDGGEITKADRSFWSHPPAPECHTSAVWLIGQVP